MKPWIFEYEFHILDKDKFHNYKAVLNKDNTLYK